MSSARYSWRTLFCAGVLFSMLIHAAVLGSFLWQPFSRPPVIPDALPIEIAMIAPVLAAAEDHEVVDLPDAPEQSEAARELAAAPVNEQKSEIVEEPVRVFETEQEADLLAKPEPVDPIPDPEPVAESDPIPELESEPLPEPEPKPEPIAEPAPEPTPDPEALADNKSEHSAPETAMPKAVNTEIKADVAVAPRSGKLNEQMVQA